MAWTIELAPTAKRQLAALPRDHHRYRLIFIPYHEQKLVEISAILLRSEKTYR